jgi:hypothetical protein
MSTQLAAIESGVLVVPSLFAAEEMGWIAEEARGLTARLSGRPRAHLPAWSSDEGPAGTLFDIDLHEEPFRRLLAHPRLLAHVRALLPEPLYVHRTRLIGDRLVADAVWRRDFDLCRRLAGIAEPWLLTAVVALRAGVDAALFVRAPGATDDEFAVALPTGSVAFLHGEAAYAFRRSAPASGGALFLITYNAMANQPASDWATVGSFRPRPLESTLGDDCLWPPAFACAG